MYMFNKLITKFIKPWFVKNSLNNGALYENLIFMYEALSNSI